jgi:hypothetical protein
MYSVLRVPALLFGSLLIQFVSGSDNPNIVLILTDDVSADITIKISNNHASSWGMLQDLVFTQEKFRSYWRRWCYYN